MRLLLMIVLLCVPVMVEAGCDPAPNGKAIVCDNQPPWGGPPLISTKGIKPVVKVGEKRTTMNVGIPYNGSQQDSDLVLPAHTYQSKEVIIKYNDFLQMLAKVEHRDKLLNQCMAEKAVLIKLKDEQGKTISIQADQVKGLIETAETQERLGRTEEQINEALQKQLAKRAADLDQEKRLSRYKSETVWIGVVGLALWILN